MHWKLIRIRQIIEIDNIGLNQSKTCIEFWDFSVAYVKFHLLPAQSHMAGVFTIVTPTVPGGQTLKHIQDTEGIHRSKI